MRALITGVAGQDGSFLTEFLLDKGYEVHGLVHRSECKTNRIHVHRGSLTDMDAIRRAIESSKPDEIYNLGSQTDVTGSFSSPVSTGDVSGLAVVRLLECVRQTGTPIRVFQPSSSEVFGPQPPPQSETTPFRPCSPYAIAKTFAFWSVVHYREKHGLHASNGILFNHTSEKQRELSVARKITRTVAVASVVSGVRQEKLVLGNLDARRDWGFARDHVEAMWLMLQQNNGDDYAIATGESHSIREFLTIAFEHVGLDWREWVTEDSGRYGPVESQELRGDASKARTVLGWSPRITFTGLVQRMVDAELGKKT